MSSQAEHRIRRLAPGSSGRSASPPARAQGTGLGEHAMPGWWILPSVLCGLAIWAVLLRWLVGLWS